MARTPRIALDTDTAHTLDGRQLRSLTFQSVRMEYVARTLEATGPHPEGARALTVGAGRGLVSRGQARMGWAVTAVDPSPEATRLARRAAEDEGLALSHHTAPAEALPEGDGGYTLAYYADTFEITEAPDRVAAEAARVLEPGGVLIYDTVNRTALSRLIYLGLFQAIPATRIMPRGRYTAARLRRPDELARTLAAHGLRNEEVCGFKPADPRRLATAARALRRGTITEQEVPDMVDFLLTPQAAPLVTYFGYARKA
jgi:2-polyprenyl-6-hydroxyphenyl methylase / 3-demethylubiquinone-9 3-methyltransferase